MRLSSIFVNFFHYFFVTRFLRSFVHFRENVVYGYVNVAKHYLKVVNKVGNLADKVALKGILVCICTGRLEILCGNYGFCTLLADLLKNLVDSFTEKVAGI